MTGVGAEILLVFPEGNRGAAARLLQPRCAGFW